MPAIDVRMLKGRSPAQTSELIRRLTDVTVEVLGVPEAVVLVTLTEISPEHWGVGGRSMADRRSASPGSPT